MKNSNGKFNWQPYRLPLLFLIISTEPWLSVLLALSPINYRQYIIGSVIGFIVPIVGTVYFTDLFVARLL